MRHVGLAEVLTVLVPVVVVLGILGMAGLVVAVGVLRAFLLRRRITSAVAAAVPPNYAVRLWAHGAYGLWTGEEDCAAWPVERARQSLSSWYGANDAAGLLSTVQGLRSGQTGNVAWDVVRALDLLRIGVGAGYLTPDQCWDQVRALAPVLRQAYGSWEELGAAFEQGMNAWQRSRNVTDPAELGRVQRNLPILRAKHWPYIEWNAPL